MRIDEALDQQVSRGGDEVGAVGGADAWEGSQIDLESQIVFEFVKAMGFGFRDIRLGISF